MPLSHLDRHGRFFNEDIKVARKHNRKSMAGIATNDRMGKQILQEWAVSVDDVTINIIDMMILLISFLN